MTTERTAPGSRRRPTEAPNGRGQGGRAPGPGLRRALGATALALVVIAGCSSSHSKYPAFLPKKTLDPSVDATLVGTMTKPALTVEGLPVKVETSGWDVMVDVSGPVVPGEGLPVQHDATTCTWTVTMYAATADVPVSIAAFHSVDHLGSVFVMGLVPDAAEPPAVLHPGQRLTFQLRAYELVGEGITAVGAGPQARSRELGLHGRERLIDSAGGPGRVGPVLSGGPGVIWWARCYLVGPVLSGGPGGIWWARCYLVGPVGIEPTTEGL